MNSSNSESPNISSHILKKLHIGFASFLFMREWSGVERLVALLAAAMIERGHTVSIIVRKGGASPKDTVPVTPLPIGCNLIELDLDTADGPDKARKLLKEANLNIVVAMFGGRDLLWIPWLLKGSDIPLVIGECISPQAMTFERWNPYEHYGALMCADAIQVLLEPFSSQYPQALQDRITVIGNPSPAPVQRDKYACTKKNKHVLLGVGRFNDEQKQFSLLLRSWSLLAPEYLDWSLILVGDGPHYGLYAAMVEAMGIDARVTLVGSVADPSLYYAEADIFCMPSRYEGFGMVLTEAAAYALPLVGFKSCEAAADLIQQDTGVLAKEDNPASLADALRKLMSMDVEERKQYGLTAQEKLQERFDSKIIYDAWESLLIQTAQKKGCTQLEGLHNNRWNEALLIEVALELTNRQIPLEKRESDAQESAATIARLKSEKDTLQREFKLLKKKYESVIQRSAVQQKQRKRRK